MTESKIYEDDFSCSFRDPNRFLEFLKERKENSAWMTAPSRSLQFQSIEKDSSLGNLYMQIYRNNGKAEILADTMENTSSRYIKGATSSENLGRLLSFTLLSVHWDTKQFKMQIIQKSI